MYRIGIFSKMNRITTKTLRYYDELDLMKPATVDENTGYRYYSSNQLEKLNKIISLRQMGISVKEIKLILEDAKDINDVLLETEKNLAMEIEEKQKQLTKIKNYIEKVKGDYKMDYNPIIKALPRVIVASMRLTVKNYDEFFTVVPQMGVEMKKAGATCLIPEYCFNIYHDGEYKENDIDVEICEAIVEACEDTDIVKYKVIEEVKRAACVIHKGPYDTLRDTYFYMYKWISDNNFEVIGESRESFIDGIWNCEDESKWLTEIQIPIK